MRRKLDLELLEASYVQATRSVQLPFFARLCCQFTSSIISSARNLDLSCTGLRTRNCSCALLWDTKLLPLPFRERRNCLSAGGGGDDSREEEREESSLRDEGEPGVDIVNDGVSRSKSGLSLDVADGGLEFLARLGNDCEPSEDADDSSKVLFGER